MNADVCVVGGGMVGMATAIGLVRRGFQVVVIEHQPPAPFDAAQPCDLRVSAFSRASQQLLDQLGAWAAVQAMRTLPYKRLAVWENPAARVEFNADELDLPELGYMVENRLVQLGLYQVASSLQQLTLLEQVAVTSLHSDERVLLTLSDGRQIDAGWVVGADGGRSQVRELAGIGTTGWQYAQQCLAVTIKTHGEPQDITWQQFTPNGPMAFLPLYDGHGSLVWYHSAANVARLRAMTPDKLKQEIVAHFPPELVDFDILQVGSFPLTRLHANHYYRDNVVLLGDAAHCINPLAGQGVNLGFRDVAALLALLDEQGHPANRAALAQLFAAYEAKRRKDNLLMMSGMDGFYAAFSNDIKPLKWLRNLAFAGVAKIAPLKKQVLRYALGI
ncbi:2-octaprenyl-3-methyl-6-methoxy-1,4-benzoquinol hydroxylase [Bowmanella sp. JS7-9]|nr:2-octaprenyl-3-methyl-6-methoxy-1,4-benzoquinol hydroxylase [Bowmanella sp. JS7-9]